MSPWEKTSINSATSSLFFSSTDAVAVPVDMGALRFLEDPVLTCDAGDASQAPNRWGTGNGRGVWRFLQTASPAALRGTLAGGCRALHTRVAELPPAGGCPATADRRAGPTVGSAVQESQQFCQVGVPVLQERGVPATRELHQT